MQNGSKNNKKSIKLERVLNADGHQDESEKSIFSDSESDSYKLNLFEKGTWKQEIPTLSLSKVKSGSFNKSKQGSFSQVKHKPKPSVDLWVIPIYLEKFMIFSLLTHLNSVFYTLFILPVRIIKCILSMIFWWKCKLSNIAIFEIYFGFIISSTTLVLYYLSDTSTIYHWVKGKSFLKIYTFFMMVDILDLVFKRIGHDLIYSLWLKINNNQNAIGLSIIVIFYSLIHTYILLSQLMWINAAIKSSSDSFMMFLIMNQFMEVKITVFK